MSTKLVRYKDVCAALIPMIADMLQKGDIEPAIDTLKALGALEDADLAKAVKEYCAAQLGDCLTCKYYRIGKYVGCIFNCSEEAPEDWEI